MPGSLGMLELYSGIGGMHLAVEAAAHSLGLQLEVLAAMDIHPVANSVYAANFPDVRVGARNLCSLNAADVAGADLWTASPPCQPFTRQGQRRGLGDPRSDSLRALIRLLAEVTEPPAALLLENVQGFEQSAAREELLSVLKERGLGWREFLLSPAQFGLPNSRLRYYLLARRDWPQCPSEISTQPPAWAVREPPLRVGDFLEAGAGLDPSLQLPPELVQRRLSVMDIVSAASASSNCFTKSYGRYLEGTGSFLYTGAEELPAKADAVAIRQFSPREVANLMGFPASFAFPDSVPAKQRYKLLGNSLHVGVVTALAKVLLKDLL